MPFISLENPVKKQVWDILYDFLHLIGIFFRVAVPIHFTKRRVYVAASVLGLLICGIYENVILSRVVQISEPINFFSLASILSDGYKIIWFSMASFLPPEVEFNDVFQLNHLNHLLNFSFHEI